MTTIQHGCYSEKTNFTITKRDYAAAGHTDYVELLEVHDKPDDKEPFVVSHYSVYFGYEFCEVPTIELAKKAFSAVTSGFYGDIFKEWKNRGVQKMHRTLSPITKPWFYSTTGQFFGSDNQFTASTKYLLEHNDISAGTQYFVFSEKNVFCFESVAGIFPDKSVIWRSGKSSALASLRMIPVYADAWKAGEAIRKWLKFLSSAQETTCVLEFPIWSLHCTFSHDYGMIYLNLSMEEELKGVKVQQSYWKKRKEITKDLFFQQTLNPSMIDVIKFFITE